MDKNQYMCKGCHLILVYLRQSEATKPYRGKTLQEISDGVKAGMVMSIDVIRKKINYLKEKEMIAVGPKVSKAKSYFLTEKAIAKVK